VVVVPSLAAKKSSWEITTVPIDRWHVAATGSAYVEHNPIRLKVGTVCVVLGGRKLVNGKQSLAIMELLLPDANIVSVRTNYLQRAQTAASMV
jgi:hypothetical protein